MQGIFLEHITNYIKLWNEGGPVQYIKRSKAKLLMRSFKINFTYKIFIKKIKFMLSKILTHDQEYLMHFQ